MQKEIEHLNSDNQMLREQVNEQNAKIEELMQMVQEMRTK